MNTAEYIAALISRTVTHLALIGGGYGAFRLIAARVQIAAPRAPKRETAPDEAKAVPEAEQGGEVKNITAARGAS